MVKYELILASAVLAGRVHPLQHQQGIALALGVQHFLTRPDLLDYRASTPVLALKPAPLPESHQNYSKRQLDGFYNLFC